LELIARLRANVAGTLSSAHQSRRVASGTQERTSTTQEGSSTTEQRSTLGVRVEDLAGVSFPESHVDTVGGQFWVLCRLDLEAASRAFQLRLRRARAEMEGTLGALGGDASPAARFAAGLRLRAETTNVAVMGNLAELLAAAPLWIPEIFTRWLDLWTQLAAASQGLPMGIQVRSRAHLSPLEGRAQMALATALAGRGLLGGCWNLDLAMTPERRTVYGVSVLRSLVALRLEDEAGRTIAGWSFLAEGVGSDRLAAETQFTGQVAAQAETLLDQWAGPGRTRIANEVKP
jgi:hypothetical protein